MTVFEVFDPPMCCSSGVCGPSVDPALVRFAADLDWLKGQGVRVWRFNLAQDPGAFAKNKAVQEALEKDGGEGLPMVFCDATLVASGRYPSRSEMAQWAGLTVPIGRETSLFTDAVAELVALGASIASNCEPCFRFHYDKARKLGVSQDDMRRAVDMAQAVKEAPAKAVLELAHRYLRETDAAAAEGEKKQGGCCDSSGTPDSSSEGGEPEGCCG
jgi:AhpD family alkylhydroperoxidase